MGRMPVSFAVMILSDASIFVAFYDLSCFVDGQVEPFAVSAWLDKSSMRQLQVNRFFELVWKVCGNRADDLEGARAPHMSRPKSLFDARGGEANFALGAVVEKVNVSAHKIVTLLPPVCLVVALPCLAAPRQATPRLAPPSHALP